MLKPLIMFQSTHPCGVRLCTHLLWVVRVMFQSTHPCGVRPALMILMANVAKFQSTHPCGVRPFTPPKKATPFGFQSTHPCGVRLCSCYILSKERVSIHAPVWGATKFLFLLRLINSFNPRTRVGCDESGLYWYDFVVVSIHAPVWGATCQS